MLACLHEYRKAHELLSLSISPSVCLSLPSSLMPFGLPCLSASHAFLLIPSLPSVSAERVLLDSCRLSHSWGHALDTRPCLLCVAVAVRHSLPPVPGLLGLLYRRLSVNPALSALCAGPHPRHTGQPSLSFLGNLPRLPRWPGPCRLSSLIAVGIPRATIRPRETPASPRRPPLSPARRSTHTRPCQHGRVNGTLKPCSLPAQRRLWCGSP